MIYDKWQKLIHQDMKTHISETVQTFKKNLFFVMSKVLRYSSADFFQN